MCDAADGHAGWKGWMELPATKAGTPIGPWLDCSWEVYEGMPCIKSLPQPKVSRVKERPKDHFNVTHVDMVVHSGTHVDAPIHFLADGPAFDAIPLDRLIGPGVVWHIEKGLDSTIEVEDLERATPAMREGDIVVLHTGWADHYPTDTYGKHPCLSVEAAHWLVDRRAKLVALDVTTPDLPLHRRPPSGFNWPVHHALLSHGVLICEQIKPPKELIGKRVEMIFAALNVKDSDGAPTRVIARAVEG